MKVISRNIQYASTREHGGEGGQRTFCPSRTGTGGRQKCFSCAVHQSNCFKFSSCFYVLKKITSEKNFDVIMAL